MISIRSSADMARVLEEALLDPPLRRLLALRRDQLTQGTDLDLAEAAHFIVVEPHETLAGIEAAASLPIGSNLVDGKRLGETGFVPSFDYVERHGQWIEAVTTLNDDGYSLVLLAAQRIDTDPSVLRLLEHGLG